jgi:hypothetical protein
MPRTKPGMGSKEVGKFAKHLGHDDAAGVADTDVITWKESLVSSGLHLHPKTIKHHLTVLKTLYKFAKDNKRLNKPAASVTYLAKASGTDQDQSVCRIPTMTQSAFSKRPGQSKQPICAGCRG